MLPVRPCHVAFLSGAFVFPFACAAQNLVPNPGFEQFTTCPVGFSQFNGFVSTWVSPSMATSDYFNACAGTFPASVPRNGTGYQQAHGGSAYAGTFLTAGGYREYVQVQLTAPLVAGHDYLVQFFVVLHNRSIAATDDIGAFLSATAPTSSGTGTLSGTPMPQMRNATGNVITDTLNWTSISGSYMAAGGERFITLGHFLDDASTTYTATGFGSQGCYYYFDDVSVVDVTQLPIDLLGLSAEPRDSYIHLAWTTATERDNSGFQVERSTDAFHFEPIGWVPGNGTSIALIAYAFDDRNEQPEVGYYYRLRQLDLNGASTFSPVVFASLHVTGTLHWRPLGGDRFQLVAAGQEPAEIELLDAAGRTVRAEHRIATEGAQVLDLAPWLAGRPPGVYLVRCITAHDQAVVRVLQH